MNCLGMNRVIFNKVTGFFIVPDCKIQVGHGNKSWSNVGRLRIDQDFTR